MSRSQVATADTTNLYFLTITYVLMVAVTELYTLHDNTSEYKTKLGQEPKSKYQHTGLYNHTFLMLNIFCIIGIRKQPVFPVPVRALAKISLPSNARGMVFS